MLISDWSSDVCSSDLTEVSVVDGDGGRLRPDVVVKVPGGQSLVIDAQVSLNAYQDAFGAVDEGEKVAHLAAHAPAMRAHVTPPAAKSYWNQFQDTPRFVLLFVPLAHLPRKRVVEGMNV